MLNLKKEKKKTLYCFPQQLHHFTFAAAVHGVQFLHIFAATGRFLVFWVCFDDSHPSGMKWYRSSSLTWRFMELTIPGSSPHLSYCAARSKFFFFLNLY